MKAVTRLRATSLLVAALVAVAPLPAQDRPPEEAVPPPAGAGEAVAEPPAEAGAEEAPAESEDDVAGGDEAVAEPPAEAAGEEAPVESEDDVAGGDEAVAEPPAEAAGEEAPVEGEDDAAAGDAEGGGRTVLRIETDLDCMVTVGIDPPQPLAPGDVLTVEIDPGAVRVQAYLTAVPEAKTFEDVTVAAGDRQRVRLKMAKALSDLRKIEARDRTYRDIETRLMWPTRDNGIDVEWQEAVDYCAELQHGGWEDWRLPTLAELEDLEAMWSLRQFKTVDPISLSSCCSWSADLIDDDNAWNFNYRFRRAFRGHLHYSLDLRALCVRDGSDEIPENTRKNRRLAKREAKEKRKEKLRRQAEKEAAEAEAAARAEAEKAAEKDPDDGSDGGPGTAPRV